MNPYGAVAWQSGGLSVALAFAYLLDDGWFGLCLSTATGALTVMGLGLAAYYYLQRRGGGDVVSRSYWRKWGDRLIFVELLLPAGVAGAGQWLVEDPIRLEHGRLELATTAFLLAVMLGFVFGSSLWDWWYIRPARDGGIRLPPCMSAGDPKWHRLTECWFRHRLFAEVAFAAFFIVTPLAVTIEVWLAEPATYQWVTRVIGPLATLAGWAFGFSKLRVPIGMRGVTDGPVFMIGETTSWRTRHRDAWRILHERSVPFVWCTA